MTAPPHVAPDAAEKPAAEEVVLAAVVLAAVAALTQTAIGVVNGIVLDHRFAALDPDREYTVFAWASSSVTFAAAVAAAALAIVHPPVRAAATASSALLAFVSLDDALVIHERLTRAIFVDALGLPLGLGARLSAVLYFPLLAALVVALLRCKRALFPEAGHLVSAALVLLAGAVALEVVNGALQARELVGFREPADVVVASVEEGLELAGFGLVAGALLAGALSLASSRSHGA